MPRNLHSILLHAHKHSPHTEKRFLNIGDLSNPTKPPHKRAVPKQIKLKPSLPAVPVHPPVSAFSSTFSGTFLPCFLTEKKNFFSALFFFSSLFFFVLRVMVDYGCCVLIYHTHSQRRYMQISFLIVI